MRRERGWGEEEGEMRREKGEMRRGRGGGGDEEGEMRRGRGGGEGGEVECILAQNTCTAHQTCICTTLPC